MTARQTVEQRLSNMFGDSTAQAEKDQKEGQARAAKFMTLTTKLPTNHPDYPRWIYAKVNQLEWPNDLPWPPQQEPQDGVQP